MHPGTLSNLKLLLERTNVNGQVKSTCGYEPHKDFAILMLRYVNTIARDILTKRVSPSICPMGCALHQLYDSRIQNITFVHRQAIR